MKKLMLMCVAVAVAAVAQAAGINWTVSNVYVPGSTTDKITAGSCMAYLFVTDNTTDVAGLTTTSLAAVQAVLNSGDLTGLAGLAAVTKANTGAGLWSGATGLTGFSSGSLSAFVVLIDGLDAATAGNYMITGEKSVSFISATGSKMLAYDSQAGNTWQTAAVPEPTSAMLLVLGVAALALRRKQK